MDEWAGARLMPKCRLCRREIYNQDYPPQDAICDNCRSDQAYNAYCDQQYELEAQRYFETQEALKHA